MKKILIAMTMFAATIGNANAFQFETNNDILVLLFCNENPKISLKSVSPLLPPNPKSF